MGGGCVGKHIAPRAGPLEPACPRQRVGCVWLVFCDADDLVLNSELLAFHLGDTHVIGRGPMRFLIDGMFEIYMLAVQGGTRVSASMIAPILAS